MAMLVAVTAASRSATAADAACAAGCSNLLRPQDELWEVSTRGAGCGVAAWSYRTYCAGVWRPADSAAFRATELTFPTTVVYVHGLAVTGDEAVRETWQVYRALAQRTAAELPLRFVLYSWPSDIGRRPLRDARSRQRNTDLEGERLACLLQQSDSQAHISLIGHSSGCRVVSSALESLARHQGSSQVVASSGPGCRPLRAVLIAAAVDSCGLLPGYAYGQAISQVDRMLILFNPADRVLRWYRFLERGHRGPEAVGYTGLAEHRLAAANSVKVRQVNAAPYLDRHHMIGYYTSSPAMMAEVQAAVMFAR
jgi:hypothetical protein